MKKILHISKFYPDSYGGIEHLTQNTCEILSKKYSNIDILGFSKKTKFKKFKINKQKFKIISCPTNFILRSAPISFKMFSFIKNNINKYNIVHIYLPNPWVMLLIFLFLKKEKVLFVSWGSDVIKQKFLKYLTLPLQNAILKKAKKIIILSKNYFTYSNDLSKFKNKIILIPVGLKLKKNIKRNYKEKIIKILNVGRLINYKNQIMLINIANKIDDNIKIEIIGDGPLFKKLNNLIKNQKVKNKIHILKNINNQKLRYHFSSCDIFCFTSNTRAESFGISVLEALSYHKPLLIYNNTGSGMMDMIKNNYNGFVFNDENDLINKINHISKNKYILKKFSYNSKKLFQKNYHYKKISSKLFNLYGKYY